MIRWITTDKKDTILRLNKNNTVSAISTRMIAALEKKKREVPKELRALNIKWIEPAYLAAAKLAATTSQFTTFQNAAM